MKRSLISLLVGISMTSPVLADDLHQVYQLALENDPVINKAKANRDAAQQGIDISRSALLPQISASADYSMATREEPDFQPTGIEIISSDADSTGWGVTLDLSIYDHSNWVELDRAEKVARQSDTQYASTVQDLILRTTTAYLNVLKAMDNLEFVQAEKNAIERQLEQTKQRFAVGLTAITDVHEAQANFDSTVAQEIRAENQVELRLEELRAITGKYHDQLSILDTETFDTARPNPDTPQGWLNKAEQQNLALLASKLAKDIAEDDIDSARAGHYPTLSLRASKSSSSSEIEVGGQTTDLPTTDSESIGLSLNVPIYSGGRTSALTERARHQYVMASEDLELTYRDTIRSVRSSYNDVIASISTIKALKQAVVSAESALKATEAGFEVGTRTIVDVLNSTRNLYNAKRNLAEARYNYILGTFQLKKAAGNLSEQDIIAINRGLEASQS
ncbi:Outer membrane protein TolC [Saliniradius amylolyticus]|uniref:Outer membrane protein TolC n=1 Tax=Saliniradius amylolyticus TaxID=2183582 RepID=A0A2S2E0A9_9ALTE|nr:outer membrane channel protein TolC [Saliniradius amylolyticus]AWL11078.1 Outer membrane protein TolC [Saliniradius amylolyticus]